MRLKNVEVLLLSLFTYLYIFVYDLAASSYFSNPFHACDCTKAKLCILKNFAFCRYRKDKKALTYFHIDKIIYKSVFFIL